MERLSIEETTTNERLYPRTTTHFLPKFENATKRIFKADDDDDALLVVSKKHSGSLVMGPPFYAKNSTRNRFSRLPAILLQSHFDCCWPKEPDRFSAWWQEAEREHLSYSFECVAPRVLGDHGATPKAAYLVLTAISQDDYIFSPAQVLERATKWRLPLNESILVSDTKIAQALESHLFQERWSMDNRDADRIFASIPKAVTQSFLRHQDLQGSILEGFVLFKLHKDVPLAQLASKYTETMTPFRDAALADAVAWGAICLTETQRIAKKLDDHQGKNNEPVPYKLQDIWKFVTHQDPNSALTPLFQILKLHYRHLTTLNAYLYKDKIQVQIKLDSDNIFYSWPLHMHLNKCAPLFRGHVVTFDPKPSPPQEVPRQNSIIEISKLKCLKYLVRTFGIRNRLPATRAAPLEQEATIRNFCSNWNVPESHRPQIASLLEDWGAFVHKQNPALDDFYLHILEPFLAERDSRLGTTWAPDIVHPASTTHPTAPIPAGYGLIIADMSGDTAFDIQEIIYGLRPVKRVPKPNAYLLIRKPPLSSWLTDYPWTIILALGPASTHDQKLVCMWSRFMSDFASHINKNPRLFTSLEAWSDSVHNLPTLPPPRTVPIIATFALPPGSGKSTLFQKLADRLPSLQIVSSDQIRRDNKTKQQKSAFQTAFKEALLTRGNIVAYDKNIPDIYGLAALHNAAADLDYLDLRLVLVAPLRIDRAIAWQRIVDRDASHIGLTHHAKDARLIYDYTFADKCETSLAALSSATETIIRSDAFWKDESEIDALADRLASMATNQQHQLPKLSTVVNSLSYAMPTSPESGATWLSLEIDNTNLHCTLVPPDTNPQESRSRFIPNLHVNLIFSRYVVATTTPGSSQKLRVAFWEVHSIEGLPDSFVHYAAQAPIYHVTDSAALQGASKPRHAADAMRQRRNLDSDASSSTSYEWHFVVDIDLLSSSSLPPPRLRASLCLHGTAV